MNGVAVIRQLLVAHSGLTALVPASRIAAGYLPQGTTLPAISVTAISSVDRNLPNPGTVRHVSDRVQVTVLAANYPSQKAIMAQVKKAGANKYPTVTGLSAVTVHTSGQGPDFMDDAASIYMGTQDFRVTFSEAI